MKTTFGVLLMFLVIAFSAAPASAQYGPLGVPIGGDHVRARMQDNLNYTCIPTNDYYIAGPPPFRGCASQLYQQFGYAPGYYAQQGYPIYQNGRPISPATKGAIIGALAGFAGSRWAKAGSDRTIAATITGGLVGWGAGKVIGRNQPQQQQQPVYAPPPPVYPQAQPYPQRVYSPAPHPAVYMEQEQAIARHYGYGESKANRNCELKIENQTGVSIEVETDVEVFRLPQPDGRNWRCVDPETKSVTAWSTMWVQAPGHRRATSERTQMGYVTQQQTLVFVPSLGQ